MKDTLQVIESLEEFKISIKNNVLKTYLLTFLKNNTFLSKYDEELLTDQIISYWANQFIKKKKTIYYIYDSDLIKLEKEIYKDYVERILGCLVDDGALDMCWDSDLQTIVWKNNLKIQ